MNTDVFIGASTVGPNKKLLPQGLNYQPLKLPRSNTAKMIHLETDYARKHSSIKLVEESLVNTAHNHT